MLNERLEKQLNFLLEADRMKSLYRQTYIIADESRGDSMREFEGENEKYRRRENDAEHSFHLALFAMTLAEYSNEPVDIMKVMKMVLVHDIVEIDAGDTYCYDKEGAKTKAQREQQAADRLFGLLPEDQNKEYRGLWEEFEARQTPEARFAAALDRMQPMLLNYSRQGVSWREHDVSFEEVHSRNEHIGEGSGTLWEYMERVISDAADKGWLER